MPQIPVGPRASQIWPGGDGLVLVANQDTANAVTVGHPRDVAIGRPDCDVIPALGSAVFDGKRALYAIAPGGTAPLQVMRASSWSTSPAQTASQIGALGLATASGQTLQLGQLQTGVAPAVSGIASASLLQQGTAGNPHTILTMPGNGRIWDVSLSAALVSGGAYASGRQNAYVVAKAGAVVLEVLEMGVSNPNQVDSDHGDLSLNGLAVAGGTTLILDVNNGVSIDPDASLRASVNVLYSVP